MDNATELRAATAAMLAKWAELLRGKRPCDVTTSFHDAYVDALAARRATTRELLEVSRRILATESYFPTVARVLESLADVRADNAPPTRPALQSGAPTPEDAARVRAMLARIRERLGIEPRAEEAS